MGEVRLMKVKNGSSKHEKYQIHEERWAYEKDTAPHLGEGGAWTRRGAKGRLKDLMDLLGARRGTGDSVSWLRAERGGQGWRTSGHGVVGLPQASIQAQRLTDRLGAAH